MTFEEMRAVVDEMLTPKQQREERYPDDSYRVRCNTCGRSCSNPLPIAIIIRAWVECPECLEKRVKDIRHE